MGLYTAREAAFFAKLRPKTFNRWFFGDGSNKPVVVSRIESEPENRVVAFWDLIQAVTIRNLRQDPKAAKLSLQHIRDVVKECQDRGLTFPFARRHSLYVFSNRLILRVEDGDYIGLAKGVDKNQLYHSQIIEPFLHELVWDQNKMAKVWTPLNFSKYRIDLNSERRFGLPIVEPGGILAESLADAAQSEGSIAAAAEAFETEEEAVTLALKYREYLSPAA